MTDASHNFLTLNSNLLERLQDDDNVYGYDYNRIVDALTGNYIGSVYIAHNDTWVNTENVDPSFPGRLNYVIPKNTIQILDAVLSLKFLNYRTYSAFTLANTGSTTLSADATASSGHTHSHAHTIPVTGGSGAGGAVFFIATTNFNIAGAGGGNTAPINSDATAESGHSHSHTHGSHNHTISGSSILGIAESTPPAGVTITFDGADHTTALGGPFNSDIVEMDILSFLPSTIGVWHTINFGTTQLGQIQSHLRLIVLVSAPK